MTEFTKLEQKEHRFEFERVTEESGLNRPSYKNEVGQVWRQYVIAAVASISVSATGFVLGWTSPVSDRLTKGADSPLGRPVNVDEMAWIGSLLTIGALFGPFAAGVLVSNLGRKKAFLLAAVPHVLGWILLIVGSSLPVIYTARVFFGLGSGMVYTITPMYNAEIATDERRGALGSFIQLFVTFGFLVVYSVGPFVSYNALTYTGLSIVLLFMALFFFMPETPFYHLSKGNREEAAKCLSQIRGRSYSGVQAELDKMSLDVAAALQKKSSFKDLLKRNNLKALGIAIVMISVQQFCGINAVLFYMSDIFAVSGSTLSPSAATILIGFIQMMSSFATPVLADRAGRRILLLLSCFFTAFGLGLLGLYFFLESNHSPITESIRFIPVLSLVIFIVAFCIGLGPIPWSLFGELFAMEVKASAAGIGTTFCWITCFIVTKFFLVIANSLGMYVVFWIFSVCCMFGFFFTLLFVPETKGKSFQEIQDLIRGK